MTMTQKPNNGRPVGIGIEMAMVRNNRICLVDHLKWGVWLFPGGKWDGDELMHIAAVREAKEETGLDVTFISGVEMNFDRALWCPPPWKADARWTDTGVVSQEFIYLGYALPGDLVLEVGKAREVRWFTPEELDKLDRIGDHTRRYAREAIEYCRLLGW